MEKININKIVLPLIVIMLLVIPSVHSMGVTSPYWDTKPLILKPGQSSAVELTLQNMVGGEDITLNAKVIEGSAIAQITDTIKEYNVPFGEKNVIVHVRVTLPADANPSDEPRMVGITFSNIPKGGGEMLQLGTGVQAKFPVIVKVPEPSAAASGSSAAAPVAAIIAIAAVALAVGAILICKRRFQRRKR